MDDLVEIHHRNVVLDDAVLKNHPLGRDGVGEAQIYQNPPDRICHGQQEAGQEEGRQEQQSGGQVGLLPRQLPGDEVCQNGKKPDAQQKAQDRAGEKWQQCGPALPEDLLIAVEDFFHVSMQRG